MKDLKGCFYFRLTAIGNLIGEFTNNSSTQPQTESADRADFPYNLPAQPAGFVGVFRSTWQETADQPPLSSQLEITAKPGTAGIYSLHWAPEAGTTHFRGEAMFAENLLIGNYWISAE